jgi:hypothetical protein
MLLTRDPRISNPWPEHRTWRQYAGFAAIHSFLVPGPRHAIGISVIDVAVMDFVIPNGDDHIM